MNIQRYRTDEDVKIITSDPNDLYSYEVYVGRHVINVNPNDSVWWVDADMVYCQRGGNVDSVDCAVVIRGYKPWFRASQINPWSTLPYIDGCSTSQLIPPIRSGDPTWQLLYMHPNSSEQAHHIHSTARIVYVYKGSGVCHYGTKTDNKTMNLAEGDVLILDKMLPHHFTTGEDKLIVLPLHVWSTTGREEFNHPMFNGTHEV